MTYELRHIPVVLEDLTLDRMNPRPNHRVLRDKGSTVVPDGDNGMGMLGYMDAMDRAIAEAKEIDRYRQQPFSGGCAILFARG